MDKVMDEFAERLKELREQKGFTFQQMANELGVSCGTIFRWENKLRVPNIESLVLIAKYFGVSTDYLLGLED